MKMNETVADDRRHRIAATIAFFSEAVRFIVIPLVLLYVIMYNFPMLRLESTFSQMANSLIIFGGLIALFASLEAYFQMGSILRMIFGVLAVVVLCAWFWFIFTGKDMTFPYEQVTVSLDIVGLILVILIAVSLKGILPIAQFFLAKDELQRKKQKKAEAAAMKAKRGTGRKRVESPAATALHWIKEPDEPDDDKEPPPPDDFFMKCPVCKSAISSSENMCPHCGAWIRQKAKY